MMEIREIHALTCATKAVATNFCVKGISMARLACGAQGLIYIFFFSEKKKDLREAVAGFY